mmetsp:Transcript_2107/g.5639  ORF Transcript_2107/g.5639 Transcript_2107/m.5639 type:complete len:258 (+) Transcript_2107:358-1131(+)
MLRIRLDGFLDEPDLALPSESADISPGSDGPFPEFDFALDEPDEELPSENPFILRSRLDLAFARLGSESTEKSDSCCDVGLLSPRKPFMLRRRLDMLVLSASPFSPSCSPSFAAAIEPGGFRAETSTFPGNTKEPSVSARRDALRTPPAGVSTPIALSLRARGVVGCPGDDLPVPQVLCRGSESSRRRCPPILPTFLPRNGLWGVDSDSGPAALDGTDRPGELLCGGTTGSPAEEPPRFGFGDCLFESSLRARGDAG